MWKSGILLVGHENPHPHDAAQHEPINIASTLCLRALIVSHAIIVHSMRTSLLGVAIDQLISSPPIIALNSSRRVVQVTMTAEYFVSLTPVGMPHAIEQAVQCAFFVPAKAHPDHNRLSAVFTVATPTV